MYEFDRTTSKLTKLIGCGNDPGVTEDVFAPVLGGRSYTVQVGGVDAGAGPAGGNLQFKFQFFGDRDQDDVFDPLDHCKTIPGPRESGGCPRDMKSTVRLTAVPSGSGIIVRSLTVNARKGAHASLRCRKVCKIKQGRNSRAHAAKTVSFSKLRGRFLPAGASIEIRVTKDGYFGDYIRFDIKPGELQAHRSLPAPGVEQAAQEVPVTAKRGLLIAVIAAAVFGGAFAVAGAGSGGGSTGPTIKKLSSPAASIESSVTRSAPALPSMGSVPAAAAPSQSSPTPSTPSTPSTSSGGSGGSSGGSGGIIQG